MPMRTRDHLQTMAYAYQEICQGEEPWVALGNFMNHWYDYSKDRRPLLIQDPPMIPPHATLVLRRWAVFIAASVEWFCDKYSLPCPAWVSDPAYNLSEPWFYSPSAEREEIRQELIKETPEAFARRNIYCGNRMYNNKFELGEIVARMQEICARKAQKRANSEEIV